MKDLKDRLIEAADLTRGLPEGLQAEAFKLAFQELSGQPPEVPAAATPARRRSRSASRASASRPQAKPRRRGPKAAVEELIDRGYLAEPRGIDDIRRQLDRGAGQRFTAKAIATSVLRLLREHRLSREQGEDGNYRYQAS